MPPCRDNRKEIMKTAEEIFSENLNYERFAGKGHECSDEEYTEKWIKWYPDTYQNIINSMHEYGRQCAEQALKDASETKQIDGVTPYFSPSEQLEITNNPILTP